MGNTGGSVAPQTKRKGKGPRGPKPSITLDVVRRVGKRVGKGIPLEMALALEKRSRINLKTWEQAVRGEHKNNFRGIYLASKAKYLEESLELLSAADDLKYRVWILERRHGDLFGKPPDTSIQVNQSQALQQPTLAGISEDVLARMQACARSNADACAAAA